LGCFIKPNRIPEWEQRLPQSGTRDEGKPSGFSLICCLVRELFRLGPEFAAFEESSLRDPPFERVNHAAVGCRPLRSPALAETPILARSPVDAPPLGTALNLVQSSLRPGR
jgi:hypothetical protein